MKHSALFSVHNKVFKGTDKNKLIVLLMFVKGYHLFNLSHDIWDHREAYLGTNKKQGCIVLRSLNPVPKVHVEFEKKFICII